MSKILLVGDFVSKGKIAGNIMEPVLSYVGHDVSFLPSALISNNFSLGKVTIFDTSEHMKNCLKVWDKLNLNFDIIFIGFINDIGQKDIIFSYIDSLDYNPMIILDPIMADDGKLYQGVGEEKIDIYKKILDRARLVLSNVSEANFLGLDDYESLTKDDKKYVITSLKDERGFYNLAIDKSIEKHYYKKINHDFAGTGDLLDAIFISYYLKDYDFIKASKESIDKIYQILAANKNDYPDDIDIHIEKYLYLLDDGGDFAG